MKRIAAAGKLLVMLRLLPNILTLGRLAMSIVFLSMILYSPSAAHKAFFLDVAFVLFVVAGLTDIVDGIIARRLGVATKVGRMIDPLVDKVLVCGTFVCFAIIGEPKVFNLAPVPLAVIHWSVAAILLFREAYVTALRHIAEARGINFAATVSGKIKMLLQSFAIGTVLMKMAHVPTAAWGYWFTTVTLAAMLTVTVISGVRATQRKTWKEALLKDRPK